MAVLDVLTYPDRRLLAKSRAVHRITTTLTGLLDDMLLTMYSARGVGLAAPQVGVNKRVIVVDVTPREEGELRMHGDPEVIELINPEIVSSSGELVGEEGCLSVPGFVGDVKRKARVGVRGLDRHGGEVMLDAEDLLARVLQHEIDHLNGILFFHRLGRLQRSLLKKKIDREFAA